MSSRANQFGAARLLPSRGTPMNNPEQRLIVERSCCETHRASRPRHLLFFLTVSNVTGELRCATVASVARIACFAYRIIDLIGVGCCYSWLIYSPLEFDKQRVELYNVPCVGKRCICCWSDSTYLPKCIPTQAASDGRCRTPMCRKGTLQVATSPDDWASPGDCRRVRSERPALRVHTDVIHPLKPDGPALMLNPSP